jgi:hypothetical protein
VKFLDDEVEIIIVLFNDILCFLGKTDPWVLHDQSLSPPNFCGQILVKKN